VNKRLPATRRSAKMTSFFIGVVEPPRVAGPGTNCKPSNLRPRGADLPSLRQNSPLSDLPPLGLEIVAVLAFNAFRRN
jgi:hypothetical protein